MTTEGVSAILRREERPQATQQAGPYGGSGGISLILQMGDSPVGYLALNQERCPVNPVNGIKKGRLIMSAAFGFDFNDYDICIDEGLSRHAFVDMIRDNLENR